MAPRAVVEYECTAYLGSWTLHFAAEDAGNCNVMAAKGSAAHREHRIGVLLARRGKLKKGNEGSLFRTGPSSCPSWPRLLAGPGPSVLEACGCCAFPKWEAVEIDPPFLPSYLVSPNSAQALWGGATATSRPCVPGSACQPGSCGVRTWPQRD